ncbi:MAG: amino acid kinase [Candidatus Thiodiazotropha sp. 6PLUC9]
MWVVKFGGSLFNADNLREWLALFADNRSLIVVPGGGPFADQVRLSQNQFGFDEATAHCMALLAMEQYGRMLCGLQPGLQVATTQKEIEASLERGITPVWMPTSMVMADPEIEQSWRVTSDSLAVWLAGQLGIERVLLVKSITFDKPSLSTKMLKEHDVVDDRFEHYLRMNPVEAWMVGQEVHSHLSELLNNQYEYATRVVISKP